MDKNENGEIYNMGKIIEKNNTALAINIQKVEDKIAIISNLEVIADADVAELYGERPSVSTRPSKTTLTSFQLVICLC